MGTDDDRRRGPRPGHVNTEVHVSGADHGLSDPYSVNSSVAPDEYGRRTPTEGALPVPPEAYDLPMHDFLMRRDRTELSVVGRVLPDVRAWVDARPETAATFDRRAVRQHVDGLDVERVGASLPDAALELLGAWPLHDVYDTAGTGTNQSQNYVNPRYVHAQSLSDAVVECACGAHLNVAYDTELNDVSLIVQHDHTASCKKYHRLEARAQLLRERERLLVRCVQRFGWTSREAATRLGISHHTLGQHLGLEYGALRADFLHRSGNTYAHLTAHTDADPAHLAGIYGVSRKAMRKRAREHSPYVFDTSEQAWVLPGARYPPGGPRTAHLVDDDAGHEGDTAPADD